MRVVAFWVMIPLAGCSSVLGIEDPRTGSRIDAAVDATDPPTGDHLMFSLGDFKLAKQQAVRFHVQLVHVDGRMEDVTATAALGTDSPTIAMIGPMSSTAATVNGGSQPGIATISASLAGAAPATVKATVTTIQCHPVINELTTGTSAVNGAADEWVEVHNPCTNMISVEGWTLDYRSRTTIAGMADSSLMITLVGSMNPGSLRLYVGPGYTGTVTAAGMWSGGSGGMLAQNDGAVGLRNGPPDTGIGDEGMLVDSIAYGAVSAGHPFIETKATRAMANGLSASRLPFDGRDDGADDAQDGDGSIDFTVISTPTPGTLNAP